MPSPSLPTRCVAGTRTPSNATIGWRGRGCGVYAGVRTTRTPGVSLSTTNRAWSPACGPVGQHGLEEHVVGLVERRDVPLHAVEDVVVAVAARGRGQVGDVGAGALLGDRVALLHLAAHGRQQPASRAGGRWRPRATRTAGSRSTSRCRWSPDRACSCTSTCCSAVQPRPPTEVGMLVACRPSSIARSWCACRPPRRGARRRCASACELEADQLVGERRGPGAGGRGPRGSGRTSGPPFVAASLTDCSVYASWRA